MNAEAKPCLFCLKHRQILIHDTKISRVISSIYNVKLPTEGCGVCIECHYNIGQINEFKHKIKEATESDGANCFACKSEDTISEPGVDRELDHLLKQCTTIEFGNTETVKACATCLYMLEISIKCEKLAAHLTDAQRFCKQFETLKECNVALWKINLDQLGEICEHEIKNPGGPKGKKGRKRGRDSSAENEETASKKTKTDESVLPVRLTKSTPTVTPTKSPGKKTSSPTSSTPKGKSPKPTEKFFIKFPLSKKLEKKRVQQRNKKYGPPQSPSRTIPASPSIADLNSIFNIELRPLFIRIEHVDVSSYVTRTTPAEVEDKPAKKAKSEEFIGLDEEDVVELQQNNTSMNISISKRKSILITERIESPNSAKKKVKFSDSPSIKYVDKIDFSDDENEDYEDSDEEKDASYEDKKERKKSPRQENGTPVPAENGKPRKGRGRPSKAALAQRIMNAELDEQNLSSSTIVESEDNRDSSTVNDAPEALTNPESEENGEKENVTPSETVDPPKEIIEEEEEEAEESKETPEDDITVENGKSEQAPDTAEQQVSEATEERTESPAPEQPPPTTSERDTSPSIVEAETPMDEEDSTSAAPVATKIDENGDVPDTEMPEADEAAHSPEDVEMTETKSPPPSEDVEMHEVCDTDSDTDKPKQDSDNELNAEPDSPQEEQAAPDFEVPDKQENEIDRVKLCIDSILGEEISDSNNEATEDESQDSQENLPVPEKSTDRINNPLNMLIADLGIDESENEISPLDADTKLDEEEPQLEKEVVSDNKNQCFSLDDVESVSDDDDILNQLDDDGEANVRKRSPDLPPLGEDSL